MATTEGCLDLLTALASLDPRVKFDAATAFGWAQVLRDVPDEVLVPAGFDAARANDYGGIITVGMVEKHAQPHLRRIASDVKSAKLRRLVPADWPATQPLPDDVRKRLAAEWAANNDRPNEIAAAGGRVADIGEVGRRVPADPERFTRGGAA